MKTYYVFMINKEFKTLTKDDPYILFKLLETIYTLERRKLSIGINLFEQVANTFEKAEVDKYIFNKNNDNNYYMGFKNNHKIYNKYRKEFLSIKTHFAYLLIKTNINNKKVFENLFINKNLFVCDFKNKDYFWIENVVDNFNKV